MATVEDINNQRLVRIEAKVDMLLEDKYKRDGRTAVFSGVVSFVWVTVFELIFRYFEHKS